jgi:hypothetical protein
MLALASVLATGLAASAQIPEPQPGWTQPDATVRYVFTMPNQLRYCMVKIPAEVSPGRPVAHVVATATDRDLPVRVLHVDAREIAVMVNATYVSGGSPVVVYVTAGDTPVAVGDSGPLDPAPIVGEVRRVVGQDYPATWAQHQYQRRRMGTPFRTYRAVSYDHAQREGNPRQWRRDEWSRAGYCVEFTTWVRVTEPGKYRLAASGSGAVFLLWGEDADPVVEFASQDGRRGRDDDSDPEALTWRTGREVQLEPGVYPVRTVQISRRFCDAQPGWIPPGQTEVQEIPADRLLAGVRRLPVWRRETIDGVVHAAFEEELGPGYRFRGFDDVFASVRLRPLSADWTGGGLSHRWLIDGTEAHAGDDWTAVLRDGPHELQIVARNALGFESRAARTVRIPRTAVEEYRVAGSLQGIPSVCYDADRIWPDLWISGSTPGEVQLQCRLSVRMLDGRSSTQTGDVSLVESWGRLRGNEVTADGVEAVDWEIAHGGTVLAHQSVRLMRQPFTVLPEAVVGTELRSGGERVVLVVRRAATDDRGLATALSASSRVVCLDSTLAPLGWYAGGQGAPFHEVLATLLSNGNRGAMVPTVERMDYDTLVADPEGSLRTFAPLAGLNRFRRGDVVVVSLGLEAYVDRETPAAFERRVAGLCALLREAVEAEVVLVTPPPFDDDRTAMRPYAEAVLRVADAYGLVAADVYSAFGGHALPRRLYDGLRVTNEGQTLAAGVVARALR